MCVKPRDVQYVSAACQSAGCDADVITQAQVKDSGAESDDTIMIDL